MYIDLKEAQDNYDKVSELRDISKQVAELGLKINQSELEEKIELLEPELKLDLEGRPFFFPAIYNKIRDDKVLEDGELESNTSQEHLDILSGDWLKNRKQKPEDPNNIPVVDPEMKGKMQAFLTKLQGNEDLDLSKYYDA